MIQNNKFSDVQEVHGFTNFKFYVAELVSFFGKMPIFFYENRLPGPIQLNLITANSHIFVQSIKGTVSREKLFT